MTKELALVIIKQIAAEFVGKLEDHQKIQEAIELVEKELGLLVDNKPIKQPLQGTLIHKRYKVLTKVFNQLKTSVNSSQRQIQTACYPKQATMYNNKQNKYEHGSYEIVGRF